jgi:hypothetical protein
MVATDFLQDSQVRQWLDGIEPAWTLLTFDSLRALRQEPSAGQTAIRSKPVRITLDLSPELYRQLTRWAHSAAILSSLNEPSEGSRRPSSVKGIGPSP